MKTLENLEVGDVVVNGKKKKPISQWKIDGHVPTIIEAIEFRRDQYGWDKYEMAKYLGMGYTHYTEMLIGKRTLSKKGMCRAYDIGIPAKIILQK